VAITVAEARGPFVESICDAAASRTVGYGLDPGVQMGPLINLASKARVENLIGTSASEGATIAVDGRGARIAGYENGAFVRPTILLDLPPGSQAARTEIFGPVLGLMHANSLDEAMALANSGAYGNQASLFTSTARRAQGASATSGSRQHWH
jgi:malonate-semialdehyde dehydrogenase (acetylating)/methylmalonate-semialdehyde dehydrogenase